MMRRTSCPTAPVAPTIPIFFDIDSSKRLVGIGLQHLRRTKTNKYNVVASYNELTLLLGLLSSDPAWGDECQVAVKHDQPECHHAHADSDT